MFDAADFIREAAPADGPMRGEHLRMAVVDEVTGDWVPVPGVRSITPTYIDEADFYRGLDPYERLAVAISQSVGRAFEMARAAGDLPPLEPPLWHADPVAPAVTYDGEDALRARTRRPPADPRLRGAAFGRRGRR